MQLAERVFDSSASENWIAAYQWRLENMPNVSVFVTEVESRMVGFKIGYAESYDRYYSWLGGVDPDFQKQGIARRLMEEQHRWLADSQFEMVRT
jgi:ribosomal protein S18 acetylase RimI-like enzyme